VSKFHPIWCPIPQESNLGRNMRILGEKRVFQRPPSRQCPVPMDNVRPYLNNVLLDSDNVRPTVRVSRDPPSGNVRLIVSARCLFTFGSYFANRVSV
jgi:hypothetical protein